jgi:hypothetical protein
LHGDDTLNKQIQELQTKAKLLRELIDPAAIKQKEKSILEIISKHITQYASFLGVENPELPVRLDLVNLTLKKQSSSQREDYLWEIGSGANWMGYHISSILSLHEHFDSMSWCPVPKFIVFDQPSQVYFPEQWPEDEENVDDELIKKNFAIRSDDIERVEKIFIALSYHLKIMSNPTQIIVIEHADEITWINVKNDIHLVERWRDGEALIPEEWL